MPSATPEKVVSTLNEKMAPVNVVGSTAGLVTVPAPTAVGSPTAAAVLPTNQFKAAFVFVYKVA